MAKSKDFTDISLATDNALKHTKETMQMEDLDEENSEIKAEKTKIRDTLNRQTLIQYRQFAIDQYPKEFLKQEELISQLQDQHFKNYWTNVHLQMCRHQKEQISQIKESISDENRISIHKLLIEGGIEIVPASLWTRKDIQEFKTDMWANHRSNCIKIQSLSTATVKVPTFKEGKAIFWEFATDSYDIGFGVSFEWVLNPEEKVEVTVSDTSEDEEEANGNKEAAELNNDKEASSVSLQKKMVEADELIIAYRRECHMEVYCGSHSYPGQGYYTLKFDNSYSVWRSKWLYYRIYHTN